jgi:uncharacterized protein YkwD
MPSSGTRARALARAFASLLALGAVAATPAHAAAADRCPGATAIPAPGTEDQASAAIVCLVNAERDQRGLHQLHGDRRLRGVAERQATDMVQRSYFSHVTPGGADFGDRVRAAGYGRGHSWHAGEALAWGTQSRATPAVIVQEWLDSPHHRDIVLDPQYRELAVGVAPGAPHPGVGGATYAADFGVVR